MESLTVPPISPSALEVLGALAPFPHTGPHRAAPLRRHTRLTPSAFGQALGELQRSGFVRLEEEALWLTRDGERLAGAVFS